MREFMPDAPQRFFFFFFWPCLRHVEVRGPGMEPEPTVAIWATAVTMLPKPAVPQENSPDAPFL